VKVVDLDNLRVDGRRAMLQSAARHKVILVELDAGGEIEKCEMNCHVLFLVLDGSAEVWVDGEKTTISKHSCLMTEPATLAMQSSDGVRFVGVQIDV